MRRLWLLAAVATIACGCTSQNATPRDELADRLGRSRTVSQFDFAYQALGTDVLDCFVPNRAFDGRVDGALGALEISSTTGPLVLVLGTDVWLNRTLLAPGVIDTEWLYVPRGTDAERTPALRRVLGPDLAGYALGPILPDDPSTIARAALDAATKVRPLGRIAINGAAVDGFELPVTSSSAGSGGAPPVASPLVSVWLDERDLVVRIEVLPTDPGQQGAAGWRIDYSPITSPVPAAAPTDATNIATVAPAELRPASDPSCSLPAG